MFVLHTPALLLSQRTSSNTSLQGITSSIAAAESKGKSYSNPKGMPPKHKKDSKRKGTNNEI